MGRRDMIQPFSEELSLLSSDQSEKALQEAKAFIDGNLQQTIRDVVSDGEQGQLVVHTDLERAVKDAWIVTECVPEIKSVKVDVLGKLDSLLPPDVILATNSSSFMASEICGQVKQRDRLVNMHYYMP